MSHEDKDYFEARAEAELEMARSACDTNVVQAHYQLACAYLDKIHPAESGQQQ